ncbi:rhodanese-like domain-containing protein [Paenibacillus sepulcri]|uniref:Rhodanese-like domain-containing protein n=1 Tax=Paenibacillus sepulcri TaxID=359917 RepID=A0ABS7C0T8_9BACL|nr:rhodanese-like domain-containing protein [Paenibacillus sepulcri]
MEQWNDIEPGKFLQLAAGGNLDSDQIIDVREQQEWDYYHLDSSLLIPMNTIPHRLAEIPAGKAVYIICAHGVRSAGVCRYLTEKGYSSLHNVVGGMAAVASLQGFQYD